MLASVGALANLGWSDEPRPQQKEVALMRRTLVMLAMTALLVLALAATAFAKNTGDQPPGPPVGSGGQGAIVFHCGSDEVGGSHGTVVVNKNHFHENNCE
jgi:hypothetical protein